MKWVWFLIILSLSGEWSVERNRGPRNSTGTKWGEAWTGNGGIKKRLALLGRQSWHGLAPADFSGTWTGPSKSLRAGGVGSWAPCSWSSKKLFSAADRHHNWSKHREQLVTGCPAPMETSITQLLHPGSGKRVERWVRSGGGGSLPCNCVSWRWQGSYSQDTATQWLLRQDPSNDNPSKPG